jgi:hypothetical protein
MVIGILRIVVGVYRLDLNRSMLEILSHNSMNVLL